MSDETYEALKRVIHHAINGGANDKAFWNDIGQVEAWIDETAKEHQGQEFLRAMKFRDMGLGK